MKRLYFIALLILSAPLLAVGRRKTSSDYIPIVYLEKLYGPLTINHPIPAMLWFDGNGYMKFRGHAEEQFCDAVVIPNNPYTPNTPAAEKYECDQYETLESAYLKNPQELETEFHNFRK